MGRLCRIWRNDYPFPHVEDPKNTYCTEDRTLGKEAITYVTIPHFCSPAGARKRKRDYCNSIGDSEVTWINGTVKNRSEWEQANYHTNVIHNLENPNRMAELAPGDNGNPPQKNEKCHYNDIEKVPGKSYSGRMVTFGCCNGQCGIIGERLYCQRNSYNGDSVVCCLNDYENTGNQDDCFQSPLRQRTCDPSYRNLGSKHCGDVLFDYCIGENLFPGQDDWKQLWEENGSIDINLLQQETADIDKKKILQKIIKQPCLKILIKQLLGDAYSSGDDHGTMPSGTNWETLNLEQLHIHMLSKSGMEWGIKVMTHIIEKYNTESGGFFGAIDQDNFAINTNFIKIIYNICFDFPFLCKRALNNICRKYTLEDLKQDPNIATWCGCYLSEDIYQDYENKFLVGRPCTPMCNQETTIKLTDPNTLLKIDCLESSCIIDDFNINFSRALNPGGVTFNQICNGCGKRTVTSNINVSANKNFSTSTTLSSLSPFYYLDTNKILINNLYWKLIRDSNGNFLDYKDRFKLCKGTNSNLLETVSKRFQRSSSCSLLYYLYESELQRILSATADALIFPNLIMDTPTYTKIYCAFIKWDLYFDSDCNDNRGTTLTTPTSSGEDKNKDIDICNPLLHTNNNIIGRPTDFDKIKVDGSETKIDLNKIATGFFDISTGKISKFRNNYSDIQVISGQLFKVVPIHKSYCYGGDLKDLVTDGFRKDIHDFVYKYEEIITLDPNSYFIEKKKEIHQYSGIFGAKGSGIFGGWQEVDATDQKDFILNELYLANLDNAGAVRGPSGSEGTYLEQVNQCFCQFSGTLNVVNATLGTANFNENCGSTKCRNNKGEVIPCGGTCKDDDGFDSACNPLDPSDYEPFIENSLKNEKVLNYSLHLTTMLIIALIFFIIIIMHFYKV